MPQVKLGAKDKGHKALGRDAAAWQLTQLLGCLFIGVGVMLSSIRVGLRVHRRAVAASFGIIYAHQVCQAGDSTRLQHIDPATQNVDCSKAASGRLLRAQTLAEPCCVCLPACLCAHA